MSLTTLAEILDDLTANNRALVNETRLAVGVSDLAIDESRTILQECANLGWATTIVDQENEPWSADTIREEFSPFRIHIEKPDTDPITIALLTRVGFEQWLREDYNEQRCLLARISEPFATQWATFGPWDDQNPVSSAEPTNTNGQ